MFSEEHYSILIVKDASRILFCKKWMLIGYFADIIGEKNVLVIKNDERCGWYEGENFFGTHADFRSDF